MSEVWKPIDLSTPEASWSRLREVAKEKDLDAFFRMIHPNAVFRRYMEDRGEAAVYLDEIDCLPADTLKSIEPQDDFMKGTTDTEEGFQVTIYFRKHENKWLIHEILLPGEG